MTTPEPQPEALKPDAALEKDERKRRSLLLLLLLLLLCLCCVGYLFVRYLIKPQPVTNLLPVQAPIYYAPTYKFSITGVEKPVGLATSPDGQRLYVVEGGGKRQVKIFDRDGKLIKSFAPPGVAETSSQPRYIAVDPISGRVFLTEHLNNVIDIFDADGNFLDAIIAQDMTLTKFLGAQLPGGLPGGTIFYYEGTNKLVYYQIPGSAKKSLPGPVLKVAWSPLGLHFNTQGDLMYTDLTVGQHSVHIIPAAALSAPLSSFSPQIKSFGVQGKDAGQFDFPNSVMTDSHGNFYVSDSNNARISAWSADMQYRKFFGFGGNDGGLNLPRGLWIDSRDLLHLADAVGSVIRVYNVSGADPVYLYSFGSYGIGEGEMNYPIDVCIDSSGRVYVADSANNRVQIWSY